MNHIILAGDSIFDNAAYVNQGQSVIEQLNRQLNNETKSTLLAIDGAVTVDIGHQLKHLPSDTTHLFISSGGNDALEAAYVLSEKVTNVFEAMSVFSNIIETFQDQYREMLRLATSQIENVVVCTIYDSIPGYDKEPLIALKLFNEVILREAFSLGLPVLDLRLVFNDPADYSDISPIEPSAQGGEKIVRNIINILQKQNFSSDMSSIWLN